ncbi:HEAT repeat domain-containing protein [Candidatus Micrarchaeota archaeon]|nr:HEAT repeat domain-containing protein [Candidatus Micrarchaeota archaeon]
MPEVLRRSSFARIFELPSTRPKRLVDILRGHWSELPPSLIAKRGLTHENKDVRGSAIYALGYLGPAAAEHAGAVVKYGLTHKNPGVRVAALKTLKSFGPAAAEHAENPLLKLFAERKTSAIARRAAERMGLKFERVGKEIRLR